jgi:hypothetical protein
MTRRELLVFVVVSAVAIALLPLFGGGVLWTRPLWFDELCCTVFVVKDSSSPFDVIANVYRPGDYAPPLLHLIVWFVGRLTGGVTPVVLRSISLVCVSLGLLFLYATLRRRFGRAPSAAGTLAVASHSLVLAHAFEGRFYGPWFLFAAAFAWSLGVDGDRAGSRRRDIAVALSSILIPTIHWFGVFSLGLMCAAAVAVHGRRWREGLRLIAPSAAGFVALLVCAPMAIVQRASSTGMLWVKELSGQQVMEMAWLFWLAPPIVLAVVLLLAQSLRDVPPPAPAGTSSPSHSLTLFRSPDLAALTSLALMPVVLIVLSVVLQPSMVPRYGIVAALAWAPLIALAVASVGRVARVAVLALLVTMLCLGAQRTIAEKQEFADLFAVLRTAYEQAKGARLPIVFTSMHIIYPTAGLQRSDSMPARYLDLPDSTIAALFPEPGMEPIRKKIRLDRDQARGHARTYRFPILATQAQLDTTRRFFLLATDISLPGGYKSAELYGRALFPRHQVRRLNSVLSIFERAK